MQPSIDLTYHFCSIGKRAAARAMARATFMISSSLLAIQKQVHHKLKISVHF